MKLSREWLDEYTSIPVSDKEFSDRMTMTGSKVEGVEITGEGISRVVAGRVLSMERHPDSDHMWVCAVDAGGAAPLQIVTGAQNVQVGDMVPTALDGSTLPGGVTIRIGRLRGVESQGMLCSLKELGLDIHDYPYAIENGIFILQEPCAPGDDILAVLGLGVSVVEFEITNNRPDCLSVRGLAREAAATFDAPLRLEEPAPSRGVGDVRDYLSIEIRDSDLCPRYTGRVVKNIRIAPSPAWMRRRLRESGVRPINNIVDITNYVMLEYGQPMHAFDYACLAGGSIVVRRAREGEVIQTLDGNDRRLTPGMLVIADKEKPVALAGVMGGANSEITEATTTIVFESANFNGPSVRKTSIALGMRTDASGRYEKGLDPENTVPAIQRACQLVELLGAGEVVEGMIDAVAVSYEPLHLPLEPGRVNALLGTDISRDFMAGTLEKLGFTLEGDDITVPSWRSDVEHFADIAEEVARFYGYDVIEPTMFSGSTTQGGYTPRQEFLRELNRLCRAMGYYEIMTYSFTSPSAWDMIRLPEDSPLRRAFTIQNPLGEDTSVMRTSSLPSMLEVIASNLNKRNMDLHFFEPATVYYPLGEGKLADEKVVLTLGACGREATFFHLKGCVEAMLRALGTKELSFEAESGNPSYHPGRCARVSAGGRELGVLGQVHPLVCRRYGIETEVCCAQLELDAMFDCRGADPSYAPLPKFPAVTRDIAVVCDEDIPAARLIATIRASGGGYLDDCRIFDVYTGSHIPEGKKSVAFSLVMRAEDQTLTDSHAEEIVASVLEALGREHGAVIR